MVTLSAKIRGELPKVLRAARYLAQQSLLDVLEHAQRTQPSVQQTGGSFEVGKIPVLEAELVNSLAINGGNGNYAAAVGSYQLGELIRFRWTAPHAAPIEFGFTTKAGTNVPGRFYVTTAVDKFPQFFAARKREIAGQ